MADGSRGACCPDQVLVGEPAAHLHYFENFPLAPLDPVLFGFGLYHRIARYLSDLDYLGFEDHSLF